MGHRAQFAAILGMLNRVPDELLPTSRQDFVALHAARATMQDVADFWSTRGDQGLNLTPGFELDPVTLLWQILTKCPDEVLSTDPTQLDFISDAELRQALQSDINASNRDLSNGEWKGATVLAGSIIEALLLFAISLVPAEDGSRAVRELKAKGVSLPKSERPVVDWGLHEYIEVAHQLKLISASTASSARLAKDFRNLIHPGRARRLAQNCNRATALSAVAAVEHVIGDLSAFHGQGINTSSNP